MSDTYVKKINNIPIAASEVVPSSALETKINGKADKSSTVSNVAWDSTNKKITKTINGASSDVVTATTLKSAMSLNNVTNDAQVKRTEMGTANGVATLDANGVINTSQLPSYVDDVLEYSAKSQFPTTGETGKIYVDTSTNLTWRWSGTTYVEISPSLALGETSSTAYRGDRGKTAYDHSQLTSGNPHHVTAEDVSAVRYDTNAQGPTNTQKSNARTNIGAGTSNLALGTTSTTAAKGDHTHTTSIASDSSSGTVVTLAQDTQYKLTAGGTSVLFKTPANATKATQDSDGNVINATYFKSNTGTTTLQSGTAVKVGTQNGADVKLQLPTIPAAANNGALRLQLNGGTVTSKFTANQSGNSTLTFASGTAVGTIKVDGTDVPVTGAETGLVDFYDITVSSSTNTMSSETYTAIAASITAGRMVILRNGGNPLYRYLNATSDKFWFFSPFEELAINKAANNDATHTFTVAPKADDALSGFSQNSVQNCVVKSALNDKADASVVSTLSSNVSTLSSNVAAHTTLFHTEVLNLTDNITRFLKITFSGRVGRCIALITIAGGSGQTNAAFRLSWTFLTTSEGIIDIGKEIFSCSDLSKPPLVYRDSDSFYIGLYNASARGSTISVMMTSENTSNVSFSTVTRAVATASDKTNVPITWHAVYSETVNDIVVGYVGTDSKTLYII